MGSLAGAAKTLFISQSTLSFAIKELEREIGITLFERSRTGIRATGDGMIFIKKAREALRAVGELETIVPRSREHILRLRIATVQSGVVPHAISALVSEIESRGDELRLRCKMGETVEVIDLVADDQSDIGFIYATERQQRLWRGILDQRGLKCEPLLRAELYIILSSSDPLANAGHLEFPDLAGYTFVFSGDGGLDSFSNLTDYSAQNFDLNLHPRYIDAQDSALLNNLLRGGRRFTIGHRSPIPHFYDDISFVPMASPQHADLMAVYQAGQAAGTAQKRLTEILREIGSI